MKNKCSFHFTLGFAWIGSIPCKKLYGGRQACLKVSLCSILMFSGACICSRAQLMWDDGKALHDLNMNPKAYPRTFCCLHGFLIRCDNFRNGILEQEYLKNMSPLQNNKNNAIKFQFSFFKKNSPLILKITVFTETT